ncbi:helix-turn-helix domain-containing protein [Cohnella kolymensis]|uniref:helix-turn-helix domain-containing protein n=1 Tax=Cohnella kolymensis TaxID=1590652 RepID=UPI0006991699|nr:helix-turn-helix transcriptional regulator [Cohnella kolymensis]
MQATEEVEAQTLYQLLKSIRGNDSLREAAKKTGLSHAFIKALESGVDPRSNTPINPSPDTLRAYAKGYGVSYGELMGKAGYVAIHPEKGHVKLIKQLRQELVDLREELNAKECELEGVTERSIKRKFEIERLKNEREGWMRANRTSSAIQRLTEENEQLQQELERTKGQLFAKDHSERKYRDAINELAADHAPLIAELDTKTKALEEAKEHLQMSMGWSEQITLAYEVIANALNHYKEETKSESDCRFLDDCACAKCGTTVRWFCDKCKRDVADGESELWHEEGRCTEARSAIGTTESARAEKGGISHQRDHS